MQQGRSDGDAAIYENLDEIEDKISKWKTDIKSLKEAKYAEDIAMLKNNCECDRICYMECYTGCSRKTVTSNISLTDLKITKNGVTQSFLESLYPTILIF